MNSLTKTKHRPYLGRRENPVRRALVQALLVTFASSQLMLPSTQAAISDTPLFITSSVDPNLLFILDDSGSMHWEITPDDYIYFYYVYPRADGNYGGADYTNHVYSFRSEPTGTGPAWAQSASAAERATAAALRSPQINRSYYNPAVTYKPWVNADGTPFPNSTPAAARHHPIRATGTRNLTTENTQSAWWGFCATFSPTTGCNTTSASRTFYPAVYFHHTGGAVLNRANYTKVEIRSTTPTYTGHGRENRKDCAAAATATCTYAEEIQNFANWYTYYRSRVLAAQAGIGQAFAELGTNMRVGFGAINKGATSVDGVSHSTIISGVRGFSGTGRTGFFNQLYNHVIPAAGTPLRRALDDAGIYFSRTDNSGPWGANPGVSDSTPHLSCRQSYTILMTDGYWNGEGAGTAAATANVDGTGGPTITGPGGKSHTYSAVSPFSDGWSNTLADISMYYWKRDLRPDLANEVPTNTIDPAFWQHMVTFGVGLGVTGSVDPAAAFAAIKTGAAIAWPDPNPVTANAAKLDDLLHAGVNGRGGFFSAADPVTFANELGDTLKNISDRIGSMAAVSTSSTETSSSTHLFQALFNSGDWSGDVKAFPILSDGSIGATEIWTASDSLPAHGSRNIKTWNGTGGMDFSGAVGTLTAAQVSYLRGDDSKEIKNGGTFRNRDSKLGDIVNSSPRHVFKENFGYYALPGTEGSTYSSYLAAKASRTPVVFVGANDGMLHAFRDSDGVELFAYVPNALWAKLASLTSPSYTHSYFVDGTPSPWDIYAGGAWKTVLAGTLGAGGKAVYLLDVSNPDSFGASQVMWEFQGNTLAQKDNMGYILGTVTVARFPDGNYWAVFGNGVESTSGKSVLFMVRADDASQVKMFEVGSAGGNGLATPTLVDSNGDRIVDLVYAGDLKGNVWKFNTASTGSTGWGPAYGAGTPLFQAKDDGGSPQPITSAVDVGLSPPGAKGFMVYFGTGKYYELADNTSLAKQSVYGVVDEDGNTGGTTGYFTGANHRTQLQAQSIEFEVAAGSGLARVMSNNPVDYASKKGWVIDLLTPPGTARGERVISRPVLYAGQLLFQSIIPSTTPCEYGGDSWIMAVNAATGGEITASSGSPFDISGDGKFDASDSVSTGSGSRSASGISTGRGISGGIGGPVKITGGVGGGVGGGGGGGGVGGGGGDDTAMLYASGVKGGLAAIKTKFPLGKPRVSWRQIQ